MCNVFCEFKIKKENLCIKSIVHPVPVPFHYYYYSQPCNFLTSLSCILHSLVFIHLVFCYHPSYAECKTRNLSFGILWDRIIGWEWMKRNMTSSTISDHIIVIYNIHSICIMDILIFLYIVLILTFTCYASISDHSAVSCSSSFSRSIKKPYFWLQTIMFNGTACNEYLLLLFFLPITNFCLFSSLSYYLFISRVKE